MFYGPRRNGTRWYSTAIARRLGACAIVVVGSSWISLEAVAGLAAAARAATAGADESSASGGSPTTSTDVGAASAPAGPATGDANAAGSSEDSVLSGPRVEGEAAASLVVRDFNGALVALEVRPEVAAIDLLELDDVSRAAVEKVLTERGVLVRSVTLEHYELFLEAQAALKAGARDEMRALVGDLRVALAPLMSPTIASRVSEALPEAVRERYTKLVREYAEALAAEGASGAGVRSAEGRAGRRAERAAAYRVEMRLTLAEMARSFAAFVEERRARVDEIITLIEATPEQEARLREVIRREGEKAGVDPSPAQRGAILRAVLAELTPEQRRKVLGAL